MSNFHMNSSILLYLLFERHILSLQKTRYDINQFIGDNNSSSKMFIYSHIRVVRTIFSNVCHDFDSFQLQNNNKIVVPIG